MAANAGAIRAGRAFVELFSDDSKLRRGLDAASKRLKAWGASITALGRSTAMMGAGLVTPFLAASKVYADMGSQLKDMADRTGVSVEALSELKFAAEQSGTSLAEMEPALKAMAKNIEAGNHGLDKLRGMKPEDQFAAIMRHLSGIEDPSKRAATALQMLGKSGTVLLPMAGDVDKLREKARRLGLVMSREDAEASEAFGDDLSALWATFKMLVATIGGAVTPVLKEVAGWLMEIAKPVRDWIADNGELFTTLLKVGAALVAVGVGLALFGTLVSTLGSIVALFSTLLGVVTALLSPIGLVTAALVGLAAFMVGGDMLGMWEEWSAEGLIAMDMISTAVNNLPLTMEIVWTLIKLVVSRTWDTLTNFILKGIIGWIGLFSMIKTAVVQIFHNIGVAIRGFWAGIKAAFKAGAVWMATTLKNALDHVIYWALRFVPNAVLPQSAIDAWNEAKDNIEGGGISAANAAAKAMKDSLDADKEWVGEFADVWQTARDEARKTIQDYSDAWGVDKPGAWTVELEDNLKRLKNEFVEAGKAARDAKQGMNLAGVIGSAGSAMQEAGRKLLLPKLGDVAKSTAIDTAGTFNPFAVAGLGADNLTKRIADANDEQVAILKDIRGEVRDGGKFV